MIRAFLVAALVLVSPLGVAEAEPGTPAPSDCVSANMLGALADCEWTYAEYSKNSNSGDASHTWRVVRKCGNGGICTEWVACTENGEAGHVYDVYRDGVDVGDVCVPESEQDAVDVTVAAARAFQHLSWPASKLSVQPPRGRTLVNFETIFFTTNTAPTRQTLTLLGQRVEIEAAPTAYIWTFGDGTTQTTASPGHPYPDHDVSHQYAHAGSVGPRVDTTYTGRFRVESGDWEPITQTLTVAGAPVELSVLEARPKLVR